MRATVMFEAGEFASAPNSFVASWLPDVPSSLVLLIYPRLRLRTALNSQNWHITVISL